MLNIYANAIKIATRMGPVTPSDEPATPATRKKAWLPQSHWWLQQEQDIRPPKRHAKPADL